MAYGAMPVGSLSQAHPSGAWGIWLFFLVSKMLRWSEPEATGEFAATTPSNKLEDPSDLLDLAPLSSSFSGLRGGGRRGREEEMLGPHFLSSSMWSWSSFPAASSAELRRPPPCGRWSVFTRLLAFLTEGRSCQGSAICRMNPFLLASVPDGRQLGFQQEAASSSFSICWWSSGRNQRAPSGFVPGGVAANPARNPLRTRLQLQFCVGGPFCKCSGLGCIFLYVFRSTCKLCNRLDNLM